jgi:hypothetical protein
MLTESNKSEKARERARRWAEANPERNRERAREWARQNAERNRARVKAWRAANRDRHNERNAEWVKRNPGKVNATTARRRAKLAQATPPWADHDAIRVVYEMAAAHTDLFGIPYHVDHIVPLAGKNVCGLHVPANLQILPGRDNQRKGNRFEP